MRGDSGVRGRMVVAPRLNTWAGAGVRTERVTFSSAAGARRWSVVPTFAVRLRDAFVLY